MTGSQLSKMRIIPEYDPEVLCPKFETHAYTERKEKELALAIDRVIRKGSNLLPYETLYRFRQNLSNNIDNERYLLDLANMPLSSWVQKREIRRIVISNATAFVDKTPYERLGFLTSLDYKLIVPIEEIHKFDIREANKRFQKAIIKRLSRRPNWRGFLFAFWESEGEPNRMQSQFHSHIVASDDVLDVTKGYLKELLAKSRDNCDTIKSHGKSKVLTGKCAAEIAKVFGYCTKTEIKAKAISFPGKNGKTIRARKKHYMKDDMLVAMWNYFNDKTIGDVITLIGIRPTKSGFTYTRGGV